MYFVNYRRHLLLNTTERHGRVVGLFLFRIFEIPGLNLGPEPDWGCSGFPHFLQCLNLRRACFASRPFQFSTH
jgi:hypothetical protein